MRKKLNKNQLNICYKKHLFLQIMTLQKSVRSLKGVVNKILTNRGNTQVLIICWLLPLLVEIDAATFVVNMTNQSQDITKKQFRRQLSLPPLTLYCTIHIWKENISCF